VKLHAQGQDVISDMAILTVIPDTSPPAISSAYSSANLDAIIVSFTESVTGAAAAFSLSVD